MSNPVVSASYKTTRLNKYHGGHTAMDVLNHLMHAMDVWLDAPFSDVRARWMEYAVAINETVMYQNAPAKMIGIDADGALILHRDGVEMRVYGDEISV